MPEILEQKDGSVVTGRVPLTDIIESSTVKRLQDHGYSIGHIGDEDGSTPPTKRDAAVLGTAAPGASASAPAQEAGAETEMTDEVIDQGVAVAEHAVEGFGKRLNDGDERKVVESLFKFFVQGKKPRGVKFEKADDEAA